MGRAHLSAAYGIDDVPARKSPCYEPPRYIDAPFDLDVDAPDAVYEAFLTGEEANSLRFPIAPRENTASPVESIESDEAPSEATTQPSTRVPSPVRQDRGPRSDSPVDTGVRVMELLEPLTNARVAAGPAIQAVLDEGITEVRPLVRRLLSVLRPHISAALDPFLGEIPEVEFLGRMFERSLVLDLLGTSTPSRPAMRLPADEIVSALDAAEQPAFVAQVRDEDMEISPRTSTLPLPTNFQRSRSPLSTGFPSLEDRASGSVSPPPVIRLSSSGRPGPAYYRASRSIRPINLSMDVDSDDDARSTTSSSFSSGPFSVRSGTPTFAPRVFRARDSIPRHTPTDIPGRAAFVPATHYLTPEPLR